MIEPVPIHDAPQITSLIERVVRISVDASETEKEAILGHIGFNIEQWLQNSEAILHLKFVRDGSIIGVLMIKDFWNLCHLFVAPECQGQGVGKALIACAISTCRNKSPRRYLRLNSSRNAISFYEHLGFVLVPDAPPPFTGIQYEFAL